MVCEESEDWLGSDHVAVPSTSKRNLLPGAAFRVRSFGLGGALVRGE
jgi:hypothetical protein